MVLGEVGIMVYNVAGFTDFKYNNFIIIRYG